MRDLERNGKLIYHSKRRLTEDGVEYFDVPVALRCNPMPVSMDYSSLPKGQVVRASKKFTISRSSLRETLVFNPYGYDSPIEGESIYGMDSNNPYGWVDTYLTRWINDLNSADRFYVDVEPDIDYTSYMMAENADYMVIAVEDTPNYITVILQRLDV